MILLDYVTICLQIYENWSGTQQNIQIISKNILKNILNFQN